MGGSGVLGYLLAALLVVAALALTLSVIPGRPQTPLFFAATLISAYVSGIGPGLVAALLSSLAVAYFILPPAPSWNMSVADFPLLVTTSLSALFVGWLAGRQKQADDLLRQARDSLELRVREQTADLVRSHQALQAQIAESQRAEAELRQTRGELSRVARVLMMGELAASIAHEINQPLAAVVSNAGAGLRWLAAATPNLEQSRAALRRIVRDGERAGRVLGQIRSLVNKAAPARGPVDINQLLSETLPLLRSEINEHQITLRTEFGALPTIDGDRVQLQQVLINLILNALEAMYDVSAHTRCLTIRTEVSADRLLRVEVRDRGTGIEPANANQLFETFFSTKPRGMGMGLSISRTIVEAHGGHLWAAPNPGGGAIFQFTLPISNGTPAGAEFGE
jgi:C4-dicarboxylate-specific signal transduction histidine kinase